uniref:Uncharacterized protein n=2 Tax=Setaria italica TaxID=4555 RepID=K3ZPK6_SETIT
MRGATQAEAARALAHLVADPMGRARRSRAPTRSSLPPPVHLLVPAHARQEEIFIRWFRSF